MNGRNLIKKISIYNLTKGKDAQGFPANVPVLISTCYASVKTTRGYTLIKNNSDFESAHTNFTIRYNPAIKREMLIYYGDKKYKIDYCNNMDELNHWLELQAIEVIK